MAQQESPTARLYELLQRNYFDNIDAGDADTAVTAIDEDVTWVHTQVWAHDGHGGETDVLNGREEVHDLLKDRVPEMQEEGIEHKIRGIVAYDGQGAFRAEVVGPEGGTEPFMGFVEFDDHVTKYVVAPDQLPG